MNAAVSAANGEKMLWTFRYRDKFTAQEAIWDAPTFNLMTSASQDWCKQREFQWIPGSVKRLVPVTVNPDGSRVEHDPTGREVVRQTAQAPITAPQASVKGLTGEETASTRQKASKAS